MANIIRKKMRKEKNKNNQNWAERYVLKVIISLITLLTALVNLAISIVKISVGQSFLAVGSIICFFVFIGISILGFSLWNVQRSYGIITNQEYQEFVENISNVTHNILHRMRNMFYYMNETPIDEETITVESFEQNTVQEVSQLLDIIADELSKLLGSKIRVCIKCFDYTQMSNDAYVEEESLMTFARSGHKSIKEIMQEHNIHIKIEDNTDFLEIVNNANNNRQRQFFYEKNLVEYERELKERGLIYKNSNLYWSTDYITTIVCPIRQPLTMQNGYAQEIEYDLKGFLCVDSLCEGIFDNIYGDFCLDLLKGLSDILYVFLDEFMIYYNYSMINQKVEG